MPLKATKELNEIFSTCAEDTLSPKETHLVALAAQLASGDSVRARESLDRAYAAGAALEEIRCAACHSACTSGPTTQEAFVTLMGDKVSRSEPFALVQLPALETKTNHLVALAACLASACACAAGHIVEARRAGASEAEIARAACLASCVAGEANHWRFAEALQCAQGHSACACAA